VGVARDLFETAELLQAAIEGHQRSVAAVAQSVQASLERVGNGGLVGAIQTDLEALQRSCDLMAQGTEYFLTAIRGYVADSEASRIANDTAEGPAS